MTQDRYYPDHGRHWQWVHHWPEARRRFIAEVEAAAREATPIDVTFPPSQDQADRTRPEFAKCWGQPLCVTSVGGGDLQARVIVVGGQIATVYPFVSDGARWSVRLASVMEWPSAVEANIEGGCEDSAVCVFDTLYYEWCRVYRERNPPLFDYVVNAIAYRLEPEPKRDRETQKMFAHDFYAYLPLTVEGAACDEIQFISAVEGVRETHFLDTMLTVYTIRLGHPDYNGRKLDLFTPLAAQRKQFKVGQRVTGCGWMFGYAAA